ncbi:hypothetical protein MNBD_UNCLBAC01-1018 [hydrothermal vent metagenome]|uniref:Cytoskeleton protein RodZ-like C-terminal domain-containing protein n=1 Tax=hydrothermal vent metagenome TaxID=652676 RepID=A0A3B1D0F1_9ZZZZ
MSDQQEKNQEVPEEALKQARESKGLSLEMVHEATNIPMDVLRGIEEGYEVRTLSPFYRKGFLKIYAKYLDVELDKVSGGHQKEKLPKYIKKDVEEFDFKEWVSNLLTRRQKQQAVIIIGGLLVVFLIVKFILFIFYKPEQNVKRVEIKKVEKVVQKKNLKKEKKVKKVEKKIIPKPKSKLKVKSKKKKAVKLIKPEVKKEQPKPLPKKVTQSQSAVTPPAPRPTVTVPKVQKNVTLTVRAKKPCWLRVRADGHVVFQTTLRLGAVETWVADEKIEISGRNIHELEFELNGKMIGTLGRKDRRAKRLIVTKDGLKVTK